MVAYPLAGIANVATDVPSSRARLRFASSTRIVVMCRMIEKGTMYAGKRTIGHWVNADVGGSVCTTATAWDAKNPVPTAPTKSRRPSTDHATGIAVDVDQIRAITATQAVTPTVMSPNAAG
jgi:hypothetical protein